MSSVTQLSIATPTGSYAAFLTKMKNCSFSISCEENLHDGEDVFSIWGKKNQKDTLTYRAMNHAFLDDVGKFVKEIASILLHLKKKKKLTSSTSIVINNLVNSTKMSDDTIRSIIDFLDENITFVDKKDSENTVLSYEILNIVEVFDSENTNKKLVELMERQKIIEVVNSLFLSISDPKCTVEDVHQAVTDRVAIHLYDDYYQTLYATFLHLMYSKRFNVALELWHKYIIPSAISKSSRRKVFETLVSDTKLGIELGVDIIYKQFKHFDGVPVNIGKLGYVVLFLRNNQKAEELDEFLLSYAKFVGKEFSTLSPRRFESLSSFRDPSTRKSTIIYDLDTMPKTIEFLIEIDREKPLTLQEGSVMLLESLATCLINSNEEQWPSIWQDIFTKLKIYDYAPEIALSSVTNALKLNNPKEELGKNQYHAVQILKAVSAEDAIAYAITPYHIESWLDFYNKTPLDALQMTKLNPHMKPFILSML
jgi:hypothetical protein